jgi:heat shock protein HtpX
VGSSRRRELFPPDRGVQVRTAAAVVAGLLLTAALVAAIVWATVAIDNGWIVGFLLVLLALNGALVSAGAVRGPDWHDPEARRKRWAARLHPAEALATDLRRVEPIVGRLAMVADLRPPQVRIEPDDAPLSWTTAFPARRPKLHLTTGLLRRCTEDQQADVVAHELSHIAQGDAWLMTLVGGPPAWILHGLRALERRGKRDLPYVVTLFASGSFLGVLALPGALASRFASRHRELSADRGAAALTGSPAGVAATLLALSRSLETIPAADLRALAARDPFYLLPAGPEPTGWRRLWATHPPLPQRLEQLERMEASLQAARPRLVDGGAATPASPGTP